MNPVQAVASHPAAGAAKQSDTTLSFDTEKLDRLLDAAGIDVLVASSKHNIQYLLGGYRSSSSTARTRRA